MSPIFVLLLLSTSSDFLFVLEQHFLEDAIEFGGEIERWFWVLLGSDRSLGPAWLNNLGEAANGASSAEDVASASMLSQGVRVIGNLSSIVPIPMKQLPPPLHIGFWEGAQQGSTVSPTAALELKHACPTISPIITQKNNSTEYVIATNIARYPKNRFTPNKTIDVH